MDEFEDHDNDRQEATKNVKKRRGLELDAIKSIMATEDGRHFIWRMLQASGVESSDWNPDPIAQAHSIGRSDMGRWVLTEIKQAAFGSYMKMIEEHRDGR